MTTDKSAIAHEITKKLAANYTLEASFIDDVEKLLVEVFAPYYIYNAPPGATGGGKKGRKGKKGETVKSDKPRKTSTYNQFVKTQMPILKTQGVPHTERMKKLGAMWKALDDNGKVQYQAMADEANALLGLSSTLATSATPATQAT